jgi:Protein of unknown function (DUF2975)
MNKIKINNWWIITPLFVAGVLFLATFPEDNRPNVPHTLLYSIKPYTDSLIDSTTNYRRYKELLDSLQKIEQWKRSRLQGLGDGTGSNFFKVRKIVECDSCGQIASFLPENSPLRKTKYFFVLNNFTLKTDAAFIIEKDKYIIKYTVWDHHTSTSSSGHPEYKEVNVRFSADLRPFTRNNTSLLIPISRKTYQLWIFFSYLFIPILIIISWISFILPIQVLYRISLGNCFIEKNIKSLRLAGWTLIGITFCPIIQSLIVELVMGNQIPKEIYYPVWLSLIDKKGWLVGGVAFLIISIALNQGMKIKQEQDLTI